MAIEVKLPEIGEGVDSADVLEILVNEGDQVNKGQPLAEFESEKASFTVESTHSGRVDKIHVKTGDTVDVGAVLVTLEGGKEGEKSTAKPASRADEQEAKQERKKEEATSRTGEKPEAKPEPKPVAKSESQEAPAPAKAPAAKEDSQRKPEPRRETAAPAARSLEPTSTEATDALIPAGPAVRRFAREVGVDLRNVTGSGEGGRITREDVLQAVRSSSQRGGVATQEAPKEAARPAGAQGDGQAERDSWGPVRMVKMSRIRKTIAQQMHRSWTTAPRVTNFDDADITELEKIRQASKSDYAAAGVKLTAMPFVIKALAHSLRSNPDLNASIDMESDQIVYKEYVNIGVAIDTERGLVVPSLRGADRLSISEIARQLAALAETARKNKLTLEDFKGSTFTVSNMGSVGGTYSTPIINVPEVAILLVGRSRKMPMVVGEQILPRLMMPLSLSYDHRLVDGAAAARFLNEVISYLEAPSRLLLAP